MFFVSCVSHAFASVHCCLVVTYWERADLLALAVDIYWVFFVSFPCGILGQVWCLIVSFPDLCHLSYFVRPIKTDGKLCNSGILIYKESEVCKIDMKWL